MRKNLTLILCLVIGTCTFAQDVVKPSSVGFSLGLIDFQTPAQADATTLKDVIKSGDWAKIRGRMNPAFSIQYIKGITTFIDFAATYTGSFIQNPPLISVTDEVKYFHSLDAAFNIKLLKESAVINPYLSAGISGYNYDSKWGIKVPLGLGIQFRATEDVAVSLQALYKAKLEDQGTYHLVYSLGVAVPLVKPKQPKVEAPPPPPPPPPAPPVVETPKPVDTDGDGITDDIDKCPSVAGLSKYNGCPIPDTDKDGINDETDKCPTVSGLARYGGCPIPDTDGDGVNDEADKCPNVAGPADNNGCPRLEQYNFNYKNVQFATGSAILVPKAKVELDKLVVILNEHPELKVSIDGYTDNTGTAKVNQALSEKRAGSVKTYLIKKGVSADKLTAIGHGIDNPIADNKTAAGRMQNRRVEFSAQQ